MLFLGWVSISVRARGKARELGSLVGIRGSVEDEEGAYRRRGGAWRCRSIGRMLLCRRRTFWVELRRAKVGKMVEDINW